MRSLFLAIAALGVSIYSAAAAEPSPEAKAALDHSVRQLRESHGTWSATTRFLKPDGSVAKEAVGTYTFDWVIEDRVLRGVSEIPELTNKSAILFYVNEGRGLIEMASVGNDGHLWVMTGPAGRTARKCGCASPALTSLPTASSRRWKSQPMAVRPGSKETTKYSHESRRANRASAR